MPSVESSRSYDLYVKSLQHPKNPVLFLDYEAFKKNIDWIARKAGNKKIRIATKSIRSIGILKMLLESNPIFQGLMSFDLREALWLRDCGFTDILMGYPTLDFDSLEILALNSSGITLMVDLPEHLDLLETIGERKKTKFDICIDIDLSLSLPGLRFGVFRSNLNSMERLESFICHLKKKKHIRLKAIMGYEAQIAGVGDKDSVLIQILKRISLPKVKEKRLRFLNKILSHGFNIEMINGGGTGSLLTTCQEEAVTEVTVGSGFFAPSQFDNYKNLDLYPSLFFLLPIVRQPEKNIFTCLGGGYVASGAVGEKKLPLPYLPSGIKYIKHEGAGEVQTPLTYSGHAPLTIGDSVIFRHSKSGEICERFEEISVIKEGSIVTKIKTYRGEGKTFI